MDYSLDTVEEKLIHVKVSLWELQQEQDFQRNKAMAYVLDHLTMIVDNARTQYLEEMGKHKVKKRVICRRMI